MAEGQFGKGQMKEDVFGGYGLLSSAGGLGGAKGGWTVTKQWIPGTGWVLNPATSYGDSAGSGGGTNFGSNSTSPPKSGGSVTNSPGTNPPPGSANPVPPGGDVTPPPGGGGGGDGFWSDPQNIIGAIGTAGSLYQSGQSGSSGSGGLLGNQKSYFHDNPALPLGLQNLMDILSSQGRTDPKLLNRNLTANARDTEAQQQQQRGYAASRGVQNAGVTDAITAAIGAAGADRASGIHAQDAAVAEQRRRQDLQLLLDLIIKPGIDYSAIDAGQYNARQDADARRQGAYVSAAAEFANLFDWDKDEK